MGYKVKANKAIKLKQNWIVVHIVWSIFIYCGPYSQIFSLIHCYLSTTAAPILSWAYFNTLAILFSRCDSVAVLLLNATLARINKRNWSLKEKINQNLNATAKDFSLKKIVYIQGSPALCQPFFHYKPHTQTFLIFQSKWPREEELCLNNNSAFRGRYSTKFWIISIINSNV